MPGFEILAAGLQAFWNRLLGRASGPEAMLITATSRLEDAGRQLRLHLAELAMALGRTHRQLAELGPTDPLHAQLNAQASDMIQRLGHLRLQLADLDAKVLQLKSLLADLRLHADLKAVRGRLQHILGDLAALSSEPLTELSDELTYQQEVRATVWQLKQGGLLR